MPQISNTTKENDWPGLTQRPPKLLNECICQSAVGTDIMRHLRLSAQHIPMITRHLSNGSTSHFQGFMNTENSDKKCMGQENREINAYTTNTQSDKYCWYCQHISVKKKLRETEPITFQTIKRQQWKIIFHRINKLLNLSLKEPFHPDWARL